MGFSTLASARAPRFLSPCIALTSTCCPGSAARRPCPSADTRSSSPQWPHLSPNSAGTCLPSRPVGSRFQGCGSGEASSSLALHLLSASNAEMLPAPPAPRQPRHPAARGLLPPRASDHSWRCTERPSATCSSTQPARPRPTPALWLTLVPGHSLLSDHRHWACCTGQHTQLGSHSRSLHGIGSDSKATFLLGLLLWLQDRTLLVGLP